MKKMYAVFVMTRIDDESFEKRLIVSGDDSMELASSAVAQGIEHGIVISDETALEIAQSVAAGAVAAAMAWDFVLSSGARPTVH